MLPIYLFLCPRVCFIASAFVAVIVALLPSSESISHFPHFTHFHPIPQKKGESLCMRPSSAFTHIFGQFSITELRHKHPHITPTHISRHWTHLQLDFCVFFKGKGFARGLEGRTIKEWKWHKYVIQDIWIFHKDMTHIQNKTHKNYYNSLVLTHIGKFLCVCVCVGKSCFRVKEICFYCW